MLHVKLSVRETDIIPAAKTAIDKSKQTRNKNNSSVHLEAGEQKQTEKIEGNGFREQGKMLESAFIRPSKFILRTF